MKFSLILPVYGVEKYIAACIESCCRQTGISTDDYQLVIVDDQSPDASIEVARSVLDNYSDVNYKIITRKNGGLSAARNTGLANADGDYIWFVDSDDYIESNALATLADAIATHPQSQIISFGYNTIYPGQTIKQSLPPAVTSTKTDGFTYLKHCKFLSAWSRIYSRKHLLDTGVKFTEGILWEDGEFNVKLLSLTNNHFGLEECLYNYLRRAQSISTGKHVERTLQSNLSIFDSHWQWLTSHDFDATTQKPILATFVARSIIFTLAGIPELNKERQKFFYNEIARRKKYFVKAARIADDSKIRMLRHAVIFAPRLTAALMHYRMQRLLKNDINNINTTPQ